MNELATESSIDHRPKGDTLMYLHDELIRARIRELHAEGCRQRLVRLLERRNFWHRMAAIANRQARKADAAF